MKKLTPIIIIAAVILLAVFVIFACKDVLKNNDNTPNPTVVPSVVPGDPTPTPTVTPEPTPEPTEEPTAEPTATPFAEATAEPTNEPTAAPTATPSPTQGPTPTPVGPVYEKSGSFRSDTGTSINLRADWSLEGKNGGKYDVTVKVYLEVYTISCSARTDGSLIINGETISYNTEELRYSDKNFHDILFTEYTFEASKGETIDIEANWYFRGKYSGVPLDLIQAKGSFVIG